MNITVEQVIEAANNWSHEDLQRLHKWLKEQELKSIEEQRQREDLKHQEERFQLSLKWLEANRANYVGEWVALDGGHLVSHGKDAAKVHAEAVAAGVSVPLMEHISENDLLPFGGW